MVMKAKDNRKKLHHSEHLSIWFSQSVQHRTKCRMNTEAKLGIAEPLPKPEVSSPSPGLSTLTEDLKRSRVSRLLPKVTCPSPFHPRVVVCFLGTRLHSCASLFLKIRNPKSQSTNLAGSLDGAPIITQSRRHKPCSRSKYLTAFIHSWHSMLLYYSQTVSAIATATCDLRAVALLRCAVALLLFEAITLPPR